MIIRERRLEDVEPLYELASDEEVTRYFKWRASIEGIREHIEKMILEEQQGIGLSRTIVNDAGQPIGVISLHHILRETGEAELGTWIGRPYWGRGYNRRAKDAILQIAFEKLGLKRVYISVLERNRRSLRAVEKLPYAERIFEVPERYQKNSQEETNWFVVTGETFLRYMKEGIA